MKENSILEKHINHRYCELDGTKCIRCHKCESLPTKSSNWLNKVLITLVIICLIVFVAYPTLMIAADNTHHTNNNDKTQMSMSEQVFREQHGLGADSAGDNYNSMG